MNNLLDFEQYRNNLRLVERRVLKQELEHVNEGLVTQWRKFRSTLFVDRILKEEIKIGKEFEERVKSTMEELRKACKELEKENKKGSEFTKKIYDIIKNINNISFDTLSLLGDQKIDFGGFRTSVIMANVVQWGVLFSPIRNMLMIKKAYNYFLGLIKQTIRKDLISLIINFDQFQNIILQKTHETMNNAQQSLDMSNMIGQMEGIYKDAIRENFKGDYKKVENTLKVIDQKRKQIEFDRKSDTISSLLNNYDNTYKATAENIKSLLNDDTQRQLDALKTGISKLGQGDDDLTVYGEMLISSAEEKALKSSNSIHNNFLKMSEVFKLSNQKSLIELIESSEKEEAKKIKKDRKKELEEFGVEVKEEKVKFIKEEFKKIEDKYDLSEISLKEIEKLKDDKVEFSYDSNGKEYEENYSKYDILIRYLQSDEASDKLEKCSSDLKMLVPNEDNKDCYTNYIDVLGEDMSKALVSEYEGRTEKYYLDINEIKNIDKIETILKMFDCSDEKKKKKVTTVLRYISKLISFDYDELIYKFEEIGKSTKHLGFDTIIHKIKRYNEKLSEYESSEEYKKYLETKRKYTEWVDYDEDKNELESEIKRLSDAKKSTKSVEDKLARLKASHKELEKEKFDKEPTEPDGKPELHVKLRTELNKKSYNRFLDDFKKMREYTDNNYNEKKSGD